MFATFPEAAGTHVSLHAPGSNERHLNVSDNTTAAE